MSALLCWNPHQGGPQALRVPITSSLKGPCKLAHEDKRGSKSVSGIKVVTGELRGHVLPPFLCNSLFAPYIFSFVSYHLLPISF